MQTARMTISSASTQDDIVGEYLDNLNYDINGSASQCKSFIAACRALLVMHPSNWQQSSASIQFDAKLWESQLNAAMDWLNVNGASSSQSDGGVTHLSFGGSWR